MTSLLLIVDKDIVRLQKSFLGPIFSALGSTKSSTLLLTMCLFSDNLYLSTVIEGIRKSLILAVERRLLITRDKLWFRLTFA